MLGLCFVAGHLMQTPVTPIHKTSWSLGVQLWEEGAIELIIDNDSIQELFETTRYPRKDAASIRASEHPWPTSLFLSSEQTNPLYLLRWSFGVLDSKHPLVEDFKLRDVNSGRPAG